MIGLSAGLVRDHSFLRSRWLLVEVVLDDLAVAKGFDGRFLVGRGEGAVGQWSRRGTVGVVFVAVDGTVLVTTVGIVARLGCTVRISITVYIQVYVFARISNNAPMRPTLGWRIQTVRLLTKAKQTQA